MCVGGGVCGFVVYMSVECVCALWCMLCSECVVCVSVHK